MIPGADGWKAEYRGVQVVLWQQGARRFQIEVGNGVLTHFHPLGDCDFNTARQIAYERAVQFARRHTGDAEERDVETMEWEPLPPAAPNHSSND